MVRVFVATLLVWLLPADTLRVIFSDFVVALTVWVFVSTKEIDRVVDRRDGVMELSCDGVRVTDGVRVSVTVLVATSVM